MENENPTTILIYWRYFQALKYYGVFPMNIAKTRHLSGEVTVNFAVYGSGFWYWYHLGLLGIYLLNTGYEVVQLFLWPLTIGKEEVWYQALACLAWVLYAFPATLIQGMFISYKTHIGEFLTEWHLLEEAEYDENLLRDADLSDRRAKNLAVRYSQSKTRFLRGAIGSMLWVTVTLSCVTSNFLLVSGWKYPVYWYSSISLYFESELLKYASFGLQLFTLFYMCMAWSLFEVPIYAFSHGIKRYLRVNSYQPSDKPSAYELQESWAKFERARRLMGKFNWLFRWILFIYKGTTAAETCVFVYIMIRLKWKVPIGTSLIFYVLAVFFVVQLCFLVPCMGDVYRESGKFLESWKAGLIPIYDQVDPVLRRKLEWARPFGFQVGSFYQIKPSTVLTLLSVITTYLIVMLQV